MEIATQTSDPDNAGGGGDGEGPQGHSDSTIRKLVEQETFKPTRQQKGFWYSHVIEFSVNGEKGIRLSDASEGNWGGFEGRDDRSLFGDNRLQIMVRLHVRLKNPPHFTPITHFSLEFTGCLPWQSKVELMRSYRPALIPYPF